MEKEKGKVDSTGNEERDEALLDAENVAKKAGKKKKAKGSKGAKEGRASTVGSTTNAEEEGEREGAQSDDEDGGGGEGSGVDGEISAADAGGAAEAGEKSPKKKGAKSKKKKGKGSKREAHSGAESDGEEAKSGEEEDKASPATPKGKARKGRARSNSRGKGKRSRSTKGLNKDTASIRSIKSYRSDRSKGSSLDPAYAEIVLTRDLMDMYDMLRPPPSPAPPARGTKPAASFASQKTLLHEPEQAAAVDEHELQPSPWLLLRKADILRDIWERGDMTEMFNLQKAVEEHEEEDILFLLESLKLEKDGEREERESALLGLPTPLPPTPPPPPREVELQRVLSKASALSQRSKRLESHRYFMVTTSEKKKEFFEPFFEEDRRFQIPSAREKKKWIPKVNWPLEPGEWTSLGSELEVDPAVFSLPPDAGHMRWAITKKREAVGKPTNFSACEADSLQDGYVNCLLKTAKDDGLGDAEEDEEEGEAKSREVPESNLVTKLRDLEAEEQPIFDMDKNLIWPKLIDREVQNTQQYLEASIQACESLKHDRPCQTEPQLMEEEKADLYVKHPRLKKVVDIFQPLLDKSLEQRALADPYRDDWEELDDELARDLMEISGSTNRLQEFATLTDVKYDTHMKIITCVDFHPTFGGIVAESGVENCNFDKKIEDSERLLFSPHVVLLWNVFDHVFPKLVLTAPDDVMRFKFNSTIPPFVVGGCVNGQIALWDLSLHHHLIDTTSVTDARASATSVRSNDKESELDIKLNLTLVRPAAISSVEASHEGPVTDLQWLPDHFTVDRFGQPMEPRSLESYQFMTAGMDWKILVWDIRGKGGRQVVESAAKQYRGNADKIQRQHMEAPWTFKFLHQQWNPVLLMKFQHPDNNIISRTLCLKTRQGVRDKLMDIYETEEDMERFQRIVDARQDPNLAKRNIDRKPLPNLRTKFHIGTGDGLVFFADWRHMRNDGGNVSLQQPDKLHVHHDAPITSMDRNPFLNDLLLTTGGTRFTMLKEGVDEGELFHGQSAKSAYKFLCSKWSPTRPSVFFVGRSDGVVDIWDMLERCDKPVATQKINTYKITSLSLLQVNRKLQLLALGDDHGMLTILEVPLLYCLTKHQTDVEALQKFVDRESMRVKQREARMARFDEEEKALRAPGAPGAPGAGMAQSKEPSIYEIPLDKILHGGGDSTALEIQQRAAFEATMKKHWQDYLSLESSLMDQVLGRVRKTSEDLIKAESEADFDF